ncbi:MAG TPA: iron export ABC transporter permease subunit FetB [Planctomycetaceae bacterium]|nr:iron export ABC transporter permease subunit FetB [Planctomycetaceae bacterium]
MNFHELSVLDVFVAALLILVNGVISVALKLEIEKRLALATVRTLVQLVLLGYLLEWVFGQSDWRFILLLAVAMTLIAGYSAVDRVKRKLPNLRMTSTIAVLSSSWIVTSVALFGVLGYDAWKDNPAQYLIPFLGMVLGNTLNGISLGMDRLGESLVRRRGEVELILTLGGTRWEAAREAVRDAVRTGMIPILNSMMVVGIVSIPGMMTGQILSGTAPLEAVKYQIVIMFVIAAGTALGTIVAVMLSYRRLFNRSHQFLFDEIK